MGQTHRPHGIVSCLSFPHHQEFQIVKSLIYCGSLEVKMSFIKGVSFLQVSCIHCLVY